MSAISAIEWTDATWNPTTGCTKISPGCAHCYIERTPPFRISGNRFVDGKTDITVFHDRLEQPLHWRKPRRVFVNSLSDLFHEDIGDTFIADVFAVMARAPHHTFQILTKRADRMRAWMQNGSGWMTLAVDFSNSPIPGMAMPWPLPNVWLGVSVENQDFADERIPQLLQTPAAVRFISAEPLLGDVNLAAWLPHAAVYIPAEDSPSGKTQVRCLRCGRLTQGMERECRTFGMVPTLDWVIVGGESGPGARPFEVAWARSIVQQCKTAGVACFVKQLGAHVRGNLTGCLVDQFEMPSGEWRQLPVIVTPGAEAWVKETRREAIGGCLFDKKGGDPSQWPADLRVREFPQREGAPA
jgi:protein gp37